MRRFRQLLAFVLGFGQGLVMLHLWYTAKPPVIEEVQTLFQQGEYPKARYLIEKDTTLSSLEKHLYTAALVREQGFLQHSESILAEAVSKIDLEKTDKTALEWEICIAYSLTHWIQQPMVPALKTWTKIAQWHTPSKKFDPWKQFLLGLHTYSLENGAQTLQAWQTIPSAFESFWHAILVTKTLTPARIALARAQCHLWKEDNDATRRYILKAEKYPLTLEEQCIIRRLRTLSYLNEAKKAPFKERITLIEVAQNALNDQDRRTIETSIQATFRRLWFSIGTLALQKHDFALAANAYQSLNLWTDLRTQEKLAQHFFLMLHEGLHRPEYWRTKAAPLIQICETKLQGQFIQTIDQLFHNRYYDKALDQWNSAQVILDDVSILEGRVWHHVRQFVKDVIGSYLAKNVGSEALWEKWRKILDTLSAQTSILPDATLFQPLKEHLERPFDVARITALLQSITMLRGGEAIINQMQHYVKLQFEQKLLLQDFAHLNSLHALDRAFEWHLAPTFSQAGIANWTADATFMVQQGQMRQAIHLVRWLTVIAPSDAHFRLLVRVALALDQPKEALGAIKRLENPSAEEKETLQKLLLQQGAYSALEALDSRTLTPTVRRQLIAHYIAQHEESKARALLTQITKKTEEEQVLTAALLLNAYQPLPANAPAILHTLEKLRLGETPTLTQFSDAQSIHPFLHQSTQKIVQSRMYRAQKMATKAWQLWDTPPTDPLQLHEQCATFLALSQKEKEQSTSIKLHQLARDLLDYRCEPLFAQFFAQLPETLYPACLNEICHYAGLTKNSALLRSLAKRYPHIQTQVPYWFDHNPKKWYQALQNGPSQGWVWAALSQLPKRCMRIYDQTWLDQPILLKHLTKSYHHYQSLYILKTLQNAPHHMLSYALIAQDQWQRGQRKEAQKTWYIFCKNVPVVEWSWYDIAIACNLPFVQTLPSSQQQRLLTQLDHIHHILGPTATYAPLYQVLWEQENRPNSPQWLARIANIPKQELSQFQQPFIEN